MRLAGWQVGLIALGGGGLAAALSAAVALWRHRRRRHSYNTSPLEARRTRCGQLLVKYCGVSCGAW